VQGEAAPDQMIRAIKYFNEQEKLPEVLVIIRGGGSADDLSAFNDELLVREIAASRIPTLVGVGHEVDESLADLVADVRAATPSNAAQIIVPDKREIVQGSRHSLARIIARMEQAIRDTQLMTRATLELAFRRIEQQLERNTDLLRQRRAMLAAYDPRSVLERGYALVRGDQCQQKQLI
jgi:exodeoxyribonuclease VII large subunit